MQRTSQLAVAFGISSCLLLSGCGGPTGPKTIPASGTISFNGEKIALGTIAFSPEDPSQAQATMAEINDGLYQTAPGQGLMVGEYKVVVTGFKCRPGEIDPKDLKAQEENSVVPKKYTRLESTDLTVTVTDGDKSIKTDFDLTD